MIKVVSKGIFYEDKAEEAIKMYEELVKESKKENGWMDALHTVYTKT